MTRSIGTFARTIAVAALVIAAPGNAHSQTFTEDFNAPGAAWESGWFGQFTDANNYYCGGARGCTNRGNAPTALWLYGQSNLLSVNFNPVFGASLTSLSMDIGSFTQSVLSVYDMSNALISSQNVVTNSNFDGGPPGYSISSTNGISRFEISGGSVAGNTNIDDISVNATAVVATPEPASIVLLATGLAGVLGVARRQRKSAA